MDRVGHFPEHEVPVNRYPATDLKGELSYQQMAERIEQFKLSLYQPSAYVTDAEAFGRAAGNPSTAEFQPGGQRALSGRDDADQLPEKIGKLGLLADVDPETAPWDKINALLEKIDRYKNSGRSSDDGLASEVLPEEDEEDEDFVVGGRRQSYRMRELDVERWRDDLLDDKKTLAEVREQVADITPARDGKLREIKQALRERAKKPTHDRDGNPNRRLLVFTTFRDTADYLYRNLADLAEDLGLNMAMVSGDETHTTVGQNEFNVILTNFAPIARKRGPSENTADIDLLIATDCISEGQNLQDCDTVLNYDIHWNPVRLIQRFGRVDRIGSRSESVRMINYWPTSDMDVYLKLESRVQSRMALADVAASGDEDPLTVAGAQLELDFRDQQLLRLREEALTMDDLDDGPMMSDFTLGYFMTQLMRYLERNREELEAMPSGAYAVAATADSAQPGVVFFLRQRNASVDRRQRPASPVHPFYLVYIHHDGRIRYGCGNTQQILTVFEAAAAGNTAPITALCDRFDQETNQGSGYVAL